MNFASDNTGIVHPSVMDALREANTGYAKPYGADEVTAQAVARIRDVFEAPDAAVFLTATGTSANSLILATMVNPYDTVFCSHVAHIDEDECNAPEFFTGGAKLTLAGHDHGIMSPEHLRAALESRGHMGVHGPQRGAISLTQATERGAVYTLDQLHALTVMAKDYNLPVHLDGARFTNALVTLGCTPAEMTWKAGIDAVSFGGTKNGLMGVEAAIFFDPAQAWQFELRRKRAAHLFSKNRYLAAQMVAYLDSDLWLDMALAANRAANRLKTGMEGAGAQIMTPCDANMFFARLPRAVHQKLLGAGAYYYVVDPVPVETGPAEDWLTARFVCDWNASDADTDHFLDLLTKAMA